MEYNKTKRGLELGAVITALVYCAFDLVAAIIGLGEEIETIIYLKNHYGIEYFDVHFAPTITYYFVGFFIGVALVVAEVIFAYKLLKTPKYIKSDFINVNDNFIKQIEQGKSGFEDKKGIRITFLVLSCILAFFGLIGNIGSSSLAIGIIVFLIFITVIVLESIAMGMKDTKVEIQAKKEIAVTSNLSIGQKIAELKHLKELGVIDEEQYKNAVEKNIKEII